MSNPKPMDLRDAFTTARPANPLFCHQVFLEKLEDHRRDSIGRRTAFLLQRLSVDARRLHYKATSGENRGWRRSRLGGNSGSHFYAWWAPRNAMPLKDSGEFSAVPEGAIFLRDIRHHDDHSPCDPHGFESHYLPLDVGDLRQEEYAPQPWTSPQERFASARQNIRLLKGYPGSGKTTALWHAADATGAERVLYVTHSADLASLARDYFDRFCSSGKNFQVLTFPSLVRQILGADFPLYPEAEGRKNFARDVTPIARTLGAWSGNQMALYDEFYAHLIGDALPVSVGRFAGCPRARVPDKAYRERRTKALGIAPVSAALEAAGRLEKLDSRSLGERYFPELALAWRAVEKLRSDGTPAPEFDCIAVDECQDLTPMESLLIIEMGVAIKTARRFQIPLLMAGDEAQTVRPTDFEWAWLSDLLHVRLGTPSEFKLTSNLRSPQRLAELINRVWDLYSRIEKRERPSGTSYAEIDDDASDQILYCTAIPGPELDALLIAFAAREGLALITLEDAVPAYVPEAVRDAVLTVSEAKGLDFHSVCVLDAGSRLDRIIADSNLRLGSEIETLRKRLAIDQLRVALSRPTERLFWLDVKPSDQTVRESLLFLNGREKEGAVSSSVPAALLKSFEEDDLDTLERIQRCQIDARQFLSIKPAMAWSRAQQAVTLLGRTGSLASVTDEAERDAAFLTVAEVCFTLAHRGVKLPSELGRLNLFEEARGAAGNARRYGLASILQSLGRVHQAPAESRLGVLVEFAHTFAQQKAQIEPWLLVELAVKTPVWVEELEGGLFNARNAEVLVRILPPFFEALALPDRAAREQRIRQRAVQLMMKEKQFAPALAALEVLPVRQEKLEAACHEALGNFGAAAACYLSAGSRKEALECYRSIPDLTAALRLITESGSELDQHPAAESLQWMSKLRDLVAERPEKFTKVVTAAEKKLLEGMLEQALGVVRKKPAVRKTAVKTANQRKPAVRKAAAKPFRDTKASSNTPVGNVPMPAFTKRAAPRNPAPRDPFLD